MMTDEKLHEAIATYRKWVSDHKARPLEEMEFDQFCSLESPIFQAVKQRGLWIPPRAFNAASSNQFPSLNLSFTPLGWGES